MLEYRVLVHYHQQNGDYLSCDMWQWKPDEWGRDAHFSSFDYFGRKGEIVFQSHLPLSQAYLIVKKSDWSYQTVDYTIQLLPAHLVTEIWLVDGDPLVYYSKNAAFTSHYFHYRDPHAFDMALHWKEFDKKWAYQGWLGCDYQASSSRFKLWAPTAKKVELIIYEDSTNDSPIWKSLVMKRGLVFEGDNEKDNAAGVWAQKIDEDLKGRAYQYHLTFDYESYLTRDPYSQATSADGKRTAIVSKEDSTPPHFSVKHGKEASWRRDNPCQSVIYEMHVRDFTQSPTSGVEEAYRGTYLGACQKGTKNPFGQATAFDYVCSLKPSYIQLQPISDRHKEYDEHGRALYNWGYDPQNYNAPETSLATNPQHPAQVMYELKTMIQAYHDAGIGVVLDVVYNHIYSTFDSPFQATIPDYFYRMNPDGSFQNGTGVGSETASEHEMFRKYMIDSLLYWVREYNIDGFRFDLMGIHDVFTMQLIREELDKIDPRILTYGEGWDMGSALDSNEKAKKENAHQLLHIGFFNDTQRDAVKGAEVYGGIKSGFVSGQATEGIVARAVLGSAELGSYLQPTQVVNYVEAHDNYNLRDLIDQLHPEDSPEKRRKRIELATAINLLMQGIAFMELGQEFYRSKLVATGEKGQVTSADRERAMNSYNAPDSVNQVDWTLLETCQESLEFIQKLITLKQTSREFSYQTYEEIYEHVCVLSAKEGSGLVIVEIKDEKHYLIIFNASGRPYVLDREDSLSLLVTNSKSGNSNVLDDLTASVFEISE